MDLSEKIIECVRKHNCLWEPQNRNYKNAVLKARLWKEIGEELNENHEMIKKKWKTMRDGYMKYKRLVKGTTGSGRKTISFVWSAQLSFLDCSISPRDTTSNISGCSRITTNSDASVNSPSSTDTTDPRSPSPTPGTSTDPDVPLERSTNRPIETTATPSRLNKKNADTDVDVDGMILDFLNKKKQKPAHDSIDYLFLSYAQTFKKLSMRKQATLKVDLAKLFSDAELSEMTPVNEYVQHLSPAYSMISTASENYNYNNDANNSGHSQNAFTATGQNMPYALVSEARLSSSDFLFPPSNDTEQDDFQNM